jgi:hypothetical protein
MKKNLLIYILWIFFMLNCSAVFAQYQYVGTYNWDGKPNNLITPSDLVTTGFKINIAATLPENRSVAIYNPRLINDSRLETISLSASSDVWISFLDESAASQNALGYYTFPTDAPLTTAPTNADIKIIFPNASKIGFGGSLAAGDKVLLGHFPANTSIGFVLIVNGWENANNKVGLGNWRIFSNSAFNPEANTDLKKHFVSIHDTSTNRIIFGFEDTRRDVAFTSDLDFNDALFYATISPIENVLNIEHISKISKDGNFSFSGNLGGLESKSLGDAISKRVYTNAINSTQGPIDYKKLNQVQNPTILKTGMGVGIYASLLLKDIMPSKMLDSGYTAYLSTAADITSITNAVDAVSVDFTINNECRAVAFATKTMNQMYDHSKAVCDRLKGAELLGMENFTLNGLTFVRYTLLQPNGHIEYASSFSIGMKLGRNSFSFQSNWLNKDYIPEETLYNIQVWSATPYLAVDITLEILNKLNKIMPVQAAYQGSELPKSYIISGKREGQNINFSINNNTSSTIGYFQIEERQSEKSISTTTRKVPVFVTANGKSTTAIPVSDSYESTISLYLNNKLQDVVFMADGSWNIDYNKNNTVVNNFKITNDTTPSNISTNVLPIFRNVSIDATTSDFVAAYKLLKGGGAEQDLRAYKSLKFTAKASGANMRITLVKNSIANWNEQYSFSLPISTTGNEYSINLSDFTSTTNKAFTANDITTIIFSFEIGTGKSTQVNASISKVSFTKQTATGINTIDTKNVQLYPNPSKGRFVASFRAEVPSTVTLKVLDANTGRQILSKNIHTVKGENNVNVELNQSINTNMYILSIEGISDKYLPKKLLVQQ